MNSFYRFISLTAVFWTTVSMSAYTPHETGSRTTASGAKAREGYTCAANFVPLGSVIIYDGHKYYVQDRMHPSKNRHVDIFMESYKKALEFGRKEAKVQVFTPDDEHLKIPGKNKSGEAARENAETGGNTSSANKEIKKPTAKQTGTAKTHSGSGSPQAAAVFKPQAKP